MYLLREDNHDALAIVENPYKAIHWLWKEKWLDEKTECYDSKADSVMPLYKRMGYKTSKEASNFNLIERYFLNMNLSKFFEEMEACGFYFEIVHVIKE